VGAQQTGYSPDAWEYLRQHPGHLDREFFTELLPTFAVEFGEHRSLELGEVEIEVELRNGDAFLINGVRAALTFVVLITTDDELISVPNREVVKVTIRRARTPVEPAARKPIGFSAELIEESSSQH
jgi:hypothetical protein